MQEIKNQMLPFFYSSPNTEFEICLIALFYTLITDDSGPQQIWQECHELAVCACTKLELGCRDIK